MELSGPICLFRALACSRVARRLRDERGIALVMAIGILPLAVSEVLGLVGRDPRRAEEAYRAFVQDGQSGCQTQGVKKSSV